MPPFAFARQPQVAVRQPDLDWQPDDTPINISGQPDAASRQIRDNPVNTRRSANVGTMLGQRRRRWPNIVPILAERLMLDGNHVMLI